MLLEQLTKETNTTILRQDEFVPELYEILADKNAKGNALEMANYFFERAISSFQLPILFMNYKHSVQPTRFLNINGV